MNYLKIVEVNHFGEADLYRLRLAQTEMTKREGGASFIRFPVCVWAAKELQQFVENVNTHEVEVRGRETHQTPEVGYVVF